MRLLTIANIPKIICIIIILVFLPFTNTACGIDGVAPEKVFAEETRAAVLNKDIDWIMSHIQPSGTYFIDEHFTHAEISSLLKDKNSWLHKHLFVEKASVKSYFENARNMKIKVFKRDSDAFYVSYRDVNFEPQEWKENCFVEIDGEYYFDGIFFCE